MPTLHEAICDALKRNWCVSISAYGDEVRVTGNEQYPGRGHLVEIHDLDDASVREAILPILVRRATKG